MTCLRIYFENYVDINILADSDVSSEKASFPVTNAYNSQRRSKVWRSDGYFSIDSTNKTIIFRETSGGPDLSATISEGEYRSISEMSAAIATALNNAGLSTYGVQNTLALGYRFQITSNGSGGDGSFHLMLTDASFTAEDTLGFDNAIDLTDASLTRLADYVRINGGEEFIEWDLGISSNPKGFAVIGPRNTPLKLSPGGTYKLQGNHTSTWTSPAYETTLTYHDNALYVDDEDGLAATDLRFWRFVMSDRTNGNGYLEVGAFCLGEFFTTSEGRGAPQFPLNISQVDRTEILFSEGGQNYADIKPKTAEYSITWAGLKKSDIEEIEDQFARYGTGKPFFVALDSGAVFSSTTQRRLIFCNFANEPTYQLISPNNWELNMQLREAL